MSDRNILKFPHCAHMVFEKAMISARFIREPESVINFDNFSATELRKNLNNSKKPVWKLRKFLMKVSTTQILRDIKVGKSGASKIAILTDLEPLNFDFHEF